MAHGDGYTFIINKTVSTLGLQDSVPKFRKRTTDRTQVPLEHSCRDDYDSIISIRFAHKTLLQAKAAALERARAEAEALERSQLEAEKAAANARLVAEANAQAKAEREAMELDKNTKAVAAKAWQVCNSGPPMSCCLILQVVSMCIPYKRRFCVHPFICFLFNMVEQTCKSNDSGTML